MIRGGTRYSRRTGGNVDATLSPLMGHEVEDLDLKTEQDRCDNYFNTKEWKQVEVQHWDVNRGKTAEVFTRNQMYIQQFPDKASKLVGNLYYNDYGLDSFGKKLAEATTEAPAAFEGRKEDWLSEHKWIVDYKGRQVEMTEKVFTRHTSGKYTKTRVPLLDCIPDVLAHPDEVWINDYVKPKDFRNMNFIKFYKEKVINVICDVTDAKNYRIATWFEIYPNAKIADKTKKAVGLTHAGDTEEDY